MLQFSNIDGWYNYSNFYKAMVDRVDDDAHFVEVGVWKGQSAAGMCELIYKSGKRIKFDAIDWFRGSQEHENMVGVFPESLPVEERENWLYQHCLDNLKPGIDLGLVNVIKANSLDAVKMYEDNSLDFVFLDASHEYEDLLPELDLWWNKLKPGGVFGGHDYGNWSFVGVARAVNKFAEQNDLVVHYIAREDSWRLNKPSRSY